MAVSRGPGKCCDLERFLVRFNETLWNPLERKEKADESWFRKGRPGGSEDRLCLLQSLAKEHVLRSPLFVTGELTELGPL